MTGELTLVTALHTSDFVKFINNLFETLNSKQLYACNPIECALNEDNAVVLENLEDVWKYMELKSVVFRKA